MAFDGRDYRGADFMYPAVHHPHAPLTGPALSRVLKIAYLCARRRTRMIISQNVAVNFRDPQATFFRSVFTESAFVRIAEGFRYIPDETTHIVGEVFFSVLSSIESNMVVKHRLTAVGAGTDVSAEFESIVTSASNTFPQTFGLMQAQSATFELELSNAPAGAVTEVYLEGFATYQSSGNAAGYQFQSARVWTEIRD